MLVESFLRYIRYEKNLSTHTVLSYKNDLFQFKAFLETLEPGCELQQVTPEQVREWIVSLSEDGLTARSISRKVSSLRAFYRYLVSQSVVAGSPVNDVRVPKVRKKLPVYLRRDTMDELLDDVSYGDDLEGVRNKLIIEMFYNTGIRRAELIGLKDEDVREGEIKVTGKRNKQRLVPYGAELAELIADYRRMRSEAGLGDAEYFFIRKSGEPLYPQLVYRVVKQALSQVCTLEKRSPHVLRHTFASVMLNNGAGLNSVKELLGHHSLASTEVYTHITFEELKQSYNQAFPPKKAIKKGGNMEIRIQAIHFDASEKLEKFIQKKVSKLEQYYDGIIAVEVSLKVVKPETAQNKEAGIKVFVPRNESVFSSKVADSFEEAVDVAIEALIKQLVKLKEKMREK